MVLLGLHFHVAAIYYRSNVSITYQQKCMYVIILLLHLLKSIHYVLYNYYTKIIKLHKTNGMYLHYKGEKVNIIDKKHTVFNMRQNIKWCSVQNDMTQ